MAKGAGSTHGPDNGDCAVAPLATEPPFSPGAEIEKGAKAVYLDQRTLSHDVVAAIGRRREPPDVAVRPPEPRRRAALAGSFQESLIG